MRYDLDRFETAQEPVYPAVLEELRAGHKTGHWIWFVFPQVAGLGTSAMSARYSIGSLEEARAYLEHPVLGARLRECASIVLSAGAPTAEAIFGSLDAMKVRSSMTLFHRAFPAEPLFKRVLDRYYGGVLDPATDERLGLWPSTRGARHPCLGYAGPATVRPSRTRNASESAMDFNSILIGSEDAGRLVEYYTKVLGAPAFSDSGYTAWQIGSGFVTVGPHSEVKGKSTAPGRIIWNISSSDVAADFARMKAAGAIVIAEPYSFAGPPETWIATLADPDDNYFQLMSPMDMEGMSAG